MKKKYENINDSSSNNKANKKNFIERIITRDGKGVEKDEEPILNKPGILNYFKLLRNKFSTIFYVDLYLILGNFPLFFVLIALAYTTSDIQAPDSQIYPLLQGTVYFDNSPIIMSLIGIFGKQDTISLFSTSTYILFGLTALTLFTFGPVNIGTSYILRNIIREEPVFVWNDFWYAIKKNLKNGIILGIIDLLMIIMLSYDVYTYRYNAGYSTIYLVMYALSYGLSILYFFIRMYPYLITITFDIKFSKIIKNSILFSILGIKRNILALIGTAIIVGIDMVLVNVIFPVGIGLLFVIIIGLIQYTSVYCAYPKIKQIMIDPYYKAQ